MASSNTGKLWTTEEDIELKKLYKSKSMYELAVHFNRSEGSIKSRLTKIKHTSIDSLNSQLKHENYLASRNQWQESEQPKLNHKKSNIDTSDEFISSIFITLVYSFPLWFFGGRAFLEISGFKIEEIPATSIFIYLFVWLVGVFSIRLNIKDRRESSGENYDIHANDDQFDDFND